MKVFGAGKEKQERMMEVQITELGNPACPQGEYGERMLQRMNQSHLALAKWGLDLLDVRPYDRVMDIGCGGGAAIQYLAEQIPRIQLVGVDYSPVSVEKTKETNANLVASGQLKVIRASVSDLPCMSSGFDKIYGIETFYFWPDPVNDLKELRRVLKPGGKLMIINDIYDTETLTLEERANVAKFDLFNPGLDEFRDLLTEAGFQNIQICTRSEVPWIAVSGVKPDEISK